MKGIIKDNKRSDQKKKLMILDMNYGPNGGMIDVKLVNNEHVTLVKCDEFCNEDQDPKFEGVLSYLKAARKIASMSTPARAIYPDVVVIDPPYASWGGGHSLLTCDMEKSWNMIGYAYSYGLGCHKLKKHQFKSFYIKELHQFFDKGANKTKRWFYFNKVSDEWKNELSFDDSSLGSFHMHQLN